LYRRWPGHSPWRALRRAQLRGGYRTRLGGGALELNLALEDPLGRIHGGDLDGLGQDDGVDSGMPLFVAKAVWKRGVGRQGRPLLLGISSVWGEEHLDAAVGAGNDFETWAVVLAGEWPLGDRLALKGSAWTGSNLDSLWGGIGQGINPTLMRGIGASGGWVQLGYKATPRLCLNIGYSLDDPNDADLNDGMRSSNRSVLFNSRFNLTGELVLGFEYMRLETRYKNAAAATNDRFQSSLLYKF